MHTAKPDHCHLANPVFTRLGPALFRRAAADGLPSMVVPLGGDLAVLPLVALQHEFRIEESSADGRMLGLIAEALDYVAGIRIGERLPAEVLTGAASWDPEPRHRATAQQRLKLGLLAWLDPAAEGAAPARLETDPKLRAAVQTAFERAAAELALPGAAEVVQLVEELADELSYIEALRETLLLRVQSMCGRLRTLGMDWRGNAERQTTLIQVRRLSAIALNQLGGRFAELDAQTGEVMSTLRNIDSQRAFIRAHRDWLYRSRRAWEPVLAEWHDAPPLLDDLAWGRLARTYQFLAPRFMAVQEWESSTRPAQSKLPGAAPVMQW